MRRLITLSIVFFVLLVSGCSNDGPEQLSYDEIKSLPLNEQIRSVVDNTKLIEDEYEVVVDGNSIAIVYPAEYISDDRLTLDNSKESFPNLAMTLVEHLSILGIDEIVITSYEPLTNLTKVSALFSKETVEELDFGKWKDEKDDYPQRFYRYSDAYLIRGNVWEKLDDETRDKVGQSSKSYNSQFWDYYGSYIE
ncbi:hypothetical protein P4345_25935 [Cytobacillus horneckiae]|uniref:hypothetical protein n=1 Tax=Cytobacillus horneckiae TaxID=549687 RepID=UPI002E1A876F|nr:hypothetical protein [Cytobacillus horneckiae]